MGQIIGGAAKPKRCNLNKLSQLGIPASGEHILVSSDNSMNAAGQGNFDCYIVGDGTTAASALELKKIIPQDIMPVADGKGFISSGDLYDYLYREINYIDGKQVSSNYVKGITDNPDTFISPYIPINVGDTVTWVYGETQPTARLYLGCFNANKETFISPYSSANGSNGQRTFRMTTTGTSYIVATFLKTGNYDARIEINGEVVWRKNDVEGIIPTLYDYVDSKEVNVDEVPTEGSNNPVSSNGVYEELQEIDGKISGTETIHQERTFTLPLAVASGGQNVYIPFGFMAGTTYHIHLSSNTSNTGYFKLNAYTGDGNTNEAVTTGNVYQDISTTPFDIDYTPTLNSYRLLMVIRTIATAGECTAVITYDEVKNVAKYVELKFGKNLCDESQIVKWSALLNDIDTHNISIVPVTENGARNVAITPYIPIKDGQTLCVNKASYSQLYTRAALFETPLDRVSIDGTVVSAPVGNGYQVITNNLGRDVYAVFCIKATDANVQVEVGNTPTAYEPCSPIGGYIQGDDFSDYGIIGGSYPDEMKVITGILDKDKNIQRLRFLHVSDSHGSNIGYADTLVDLIGADFLVHTGDMVLDKYSDSVADLQTKLLAVTKPTFVTLGNHDCYQSSTLAQRFDKFISPLNTHNGITSNTKTYYSVNYSTPKVKCIFLDQQDAVADSSADMSTYIYGKMTSEQVNWFIGELQDALTNSLHVVVFLHVAPAYIEEENDEWFDAQPQRANDINFLCDIVDAFINGTSFNVTHNGSTFTGTFATSGKFCGWFNGHTHYDSVGTLDAHPKQHNVSIARPVKNKDLNDGTYRENELGITLNYVTIDTNDRKVSVYRVGNQSTWQGTERTSFYYKY